MIYLSLFISTLILSISSMFRRFPSSIVYFLLTFFVVLVIALRYDSVDYFSYFSIYEKINDLSELGFFVYSINSATPMESGFAILVLIEKLFFGHFFIFIAFFSLLSLLIKFAAFKKMTPYVLLSLLLYLSDEYFWKDLGQIRNAMASGVLLWAFYFAYFRRFWFFIALAITAMLFHSAAIVAFPFYFANYLKSRFLAIFALFLSILTVYFFGGVGLFIPDIALFLGFDEYSRIVKYATSQYVSGIQPFGGTFFLQLMVCFLMIVFYRKLIDKWPLNELFIPIYIYSSCLFFLFIDYGIISGRIREMLCIPVACVVIPSFVLIFRGYSKFIPCLAIVFYCSIWFYMMMRDRASYQTILQFLF